MITTDKLIDLRKNALEALLQLELAHKFENRHTEFTINFATVDVNEIEDLTKAVPFLASPDQTCTLLEVYETRDDKLSVQLAMTDGYIILGCKKTRDEVFGVENDNIHVYQYSDIGLVAHTAIGWLYNPTPISDYSELNLKNGIANKN